ncbi:MAG: hypothetical protein QGD95_09290, partial [Actinomycetota bacterium]|nr:hypothetical protein [Actinomycetota bacterium]
ASGVLEDRVIADAPPSDSGVLLAIGIDHACPLPCGPTVGTGETPRHLEHGAGVYSRCIAHGLWQRRVTRLTC